MPDVRGRLLPIYVLADESASMRDWIAELNTGLRSLHDALLQAPMAAAKVRFTVLGFSDTAILRAHLVDLRRVDQIPPLVCRSTTSYRAVFTALHRQIETDVERLKSEGYEVYRPAVYFLSDGQPDNGDDWTAVHDVLVDRARTAAAPHIIAFGIGAAEPMTILRVATQARYAFVSVTHTDIGKAVADFSAELTRSVVRSAESMAGGTMHLNVEPPEGFHVVLDVI